MCFQVLPKLSVAGDICLTVAGKLFHTSDPIWHTSSRSGEASCWGRLVANCYTPFTFTFANVLGGDTILL